MEIRLATFTLRPFRPGDEEALAENANNRGIWRNVRDRFPHPYTLADAAWWVANAGATQFAIDVDGRVAGAIGYEPGVDVFRRSAEVGYWLGAAHQGKGMASTALVALGEHVFATTDIVRLHAGVFAWNPASARVLEKAGFVLEGRLRSAVFKDGELVDELLYAKVRPSASSTYG